MCRNVTVLKAELVVMHAKIRRVNLQEHKNYQKKIQKFISKYFFGQGHSPPIPQQLLKVSRI